MSQHRSEVALRKRLTRAREGGSGLRVVRSLDGADALEGFVLSIGAKWVLLARLGDACLDGFVVLRLRDVARAQPIRSGMFYERLLKVRRELPPVSPVHLDLDSTDGLMRTAAAALSLVTLHIERDDPDVCFIGVPVEIADKSVWLQEINPQAVWNDTLSRWRYGEITRLDFGGRYESALIEVAGPPAAE